MKWLRTFSCWLCLILMLISSNLHLAMLQGVAWAGMAVEYSQDSGDVVDGIRRTLSGDEPCSLCSAVQEATEEEASSDEFHITPELRNFIPQSQVTVYPAPIQFGGWNWHAEHSIKLLLFEALAHPS